MFNEKLIYDVGMHNGDDTAGYLEKGYSVIAVEADPVQVQKAKERFKDPIQQGKLSVLNVGITEAEGQFDFYINEKNPEWNSFDMSITCRDGLPWHTIKVAAQTFDKIIKENGVPYYLKVDIEGNDYLCIQGLDKNNLPKFISVEASDITLLHALFEKGFTKFKLVFQYNLAHLDLPPNKYFKRWLWSYNIRQLNSFPVKVLRKFGKGFILWNDKLAIPPYSKGFNKGSSGNFGENLGGQWHTVTDVLEIYQYYSNIFHNLPNKKDYGFWVDVHATW